MSSTIEDISKRLGISVSTVSKALNAYPDVADETRERVLAAARELDYTPSAAARNLRRGRSEKIGLLINNPISFLSEYISEVIAGAALQAETHGHNLILYTAAVQHPHELKRICRSREVDGLMLIFEPSPEAVEVLISEMMPFMVFGRRVANPTVSYIAPDNRDGAYRLTRHLINLGHRRIGFTTRPELGTVSEDRFSGYRHALKDAGIHYDPALVVETFVEPNSGGRALNALLARPEPPTALFAFYDLMASDALKAAQKLGLRVPEDIAIAGFDGLRSSSITTPPITTVVQPLEHMGQQAAEMLMDRIGNADREPTQRVLPVELIVRESTQDPIA
jgi:DNA-binding LacI/PurR family transcriptional regulator